MNELQKSVESRLKNLIVNKNEELDDLFYILGYEYQNEDLTFRTQRWTENQRSLIDKLTLLASHNGFPVFWVRMNKDKLLRTPERTIINKLTSEFPYNMIVLSNSDDSQWDFVNMKLVKVVETEENKDPQKRQILRRIRIEETERLHTATQRIAMLEVPEDGASSLEIQKRHDDAFDVESLNKEFYNKIAIAFTKLVGGKRKVGSLTEDYKPLLKLPSTSDHQKMQEFAVRLIGRLVFCWFLKKKEGDSQIPLIPESVLAKNSIGSKFYHSVLEPLFFEVLNTPLDDRLEQFKTDDWQNIPFLNGGLFEPNREDYYDIDNVIHQSKYLNTLNIPDSWFTELFEIFEAYNFTIEENTSIDIDLSIDPEILGRIFENLLAEINPETGETARKNTGSYYTPRPIVDYMVDESIKQYLFTNTDIDEIKITELLSYTENTDLNSREKKAVLDALDQIKIIDPACGSGAFPMGILQKMTLILQKIDPESVDWLIKQLDRIPDKNVRDEVEAKLVNENWNYIHKLGIIQNSIYGVDIQPIAVEISKLRFFLSLIVDEKVDDDKPNRGLKPLPNLEFKFVCANSLIGLPESENDDDQVGMFTDTFFDDFSQGVNDYFNASNPNEKHKVREKIEALIDKKTDEKFETIQAMNKQITTDPRRLKEREQKTAKLTQLMTLWGSYKNLFKNEPVGFFDIQYFFPECKDGFDVVIANPPYIQLQKSLDDGTNNKYADLYKNCSYETFKRTGDIYALFYELGINVLQDGGHLTFITSNKWMRAGYGDVLRGFFAKHNPKILLDFGGFKVFESATVDVNIIITENAENQNKLHATHFRNDYQKGDSVADYFENNKVELNNLTDDTWFIGSRAEIALKQKIEEIGTPLKDWDVNIYRGVLTGYNNAFIIDEVKRAELIAQDPKSKEIIKPILRGRDIKRYGYEFAGLYLLFIPWHFPLHEDPSVSGSSKKAEIEFERQYPAIYYHLLEHKNKLSKRNKSETGIRYEWYALQRCANTYYAEFAKEKVVYPNMTKYRPFLLDTEGFLTNQKCFIITGNDIKYLAGLLNSWLFEFTFKEKFPELLGGTLELSKIFFIKLPIPPITPSNRHFAERIERLVELRIKNYELRIEKKTDEEIEAEIDRLVYKLYDLTYDEIAIVEESVN